MRKLSALALASGALLIGLVGVASAAVSVRDTNPRFIVVEPHTFNPGPPSGNGPPPNDNPPPPPPGNYYPPPNTVPKPTSVPEPATLGLLGLGALGVGMFKRRRR